MCVNLVDTQHYYWSTSVVIFYFLKKICIKISCDLDLSVCKCKHVCIFTGGTKGHKSTQSLKLDHSVQTRSWWRVNTGPLCGPADEHKVNNTMAPSLGWTTRVNRDCRLLCVHVKHKTQLSSRSLPQSDIASSRLNNCHTTRHKLESSCSHRIQIYFTTL